MSPPVANAFTVDLEDWFHILGVGVAFPFETWGGLESRVERNTERLLDLLDAAETKATFFVLGWVAEHYPDLVRRVAARGHELGSHGYHHALIYDQTPAGFRADVAAAKRRTEDLTGEPVLGYRAPGFSIRPDTRWALDVLAEEGFVYDSSVFPAAHAHGGFPQIGDRPTRLTTPAGHTLLELPLSIHRVAGWPIPYSGGGYLRLLPLRFITYAMRASNDRRHQPVNLYIHPREIDPGQPRIPGLPPHRRFRYYVGLRTAERKLQHLLAHFAFRPVREVLAEAFGTGALAAPEPALS
ncbi:MAG TPA: XrtA system polysaccharide deacetylase [Rubricoccaceae bacterium]|nr:XrtA system polysaccharide deacetylase [Rubricoccaceae bacterium]